MGPSVNWMSRFRVDVVQHLEGDLSDVVHVDVLIDDQDAFREHRLAQGPDGVHDFAGLAGIGLADGDDHQVVEGRLRAVG